MGLHHLNAQSILNSNTYDEILDTSQDKKHFLIVLIEPIPQKHVLTHRLIKNHHIHLTCKSINLAQWLQVIMKNLVMQIVCQSNTTKIEDVQEISFPHIDSLFTIEFKKDITYERLETEIETLVKWCGKNVVYEIPGADSVVPVTTVPKDVANEGPLCKIFT